MASGRVFGRRRRRSRLFTQPSPTADGPWSSCRIKQVLPILHELRTHRRFSKLTEGETFNDRYWSASREPQQSMTSRGYDPRQSPGLGYKRLCLVKTLSTALTCWPFREHGAPGRRPNIHAHFVGRQREDGLDTLPARAAEANRSTLIADIPFPAPGNVAAKRCARDTRAF